MLREYREGKNKFQEKSPIITGPKRSKLQNIKKNLLQSHMVLLIILSSIYWKTFELFSIFTEVKIWKETYWFISWKNMYAEIMQNH